MNIKLGVNLNIQLEYKRKLQKNIHFKSTDKYQQNHKSQKIMIKN